MGKQAAYQRECEQYARNAHGPLGLPTGMERAHGQATHQPAGSGPHSIILTASTSKTKSCRFVMAQSNDQTLDAPKLDPKQSKLQTYPRRPHAGKSLPHMPLRSTDTVRSKGSYRQTDRHRERLSLEENHPASTRCAMVGRNTDISWPPLADSTTWQRSQQRPV